MEMDEEEDVGPDVVFMIDVVLKTSSMMLKVIAPSAADETCVTHITLCRPLQKIVLRLCGSTGINPVV